MFGFLVCIEIFFSGTIIAFGFSLFVHPKDACCRPSHVPRHLRQRRCGNRMMYHCVMSVGQPLGGHWPTHAGQQDVKAVGSADSGAVTTGGNSTLTMTGEMFADCH